LTGIAELHQLIPVEKLGGGDSYKIDYSAEVKKQMRGYKRNIVVV